VAVAVLGQTVELAELAAVLVDFVRLHLFQLVHLLP
jgi:hypothetical protein